MIKPQSVISDFSVYSTEVSLIESSMARESMNTSTTDFKHLEIVWAQRSGRPWYPAVLFIDPFDHSKRMKKLMKLLGVSYVPYQDDRQDLKNILLLDPQKTWLLLPQDRIHKFDMCGFNQYHEAALKQLSAKEQSELKKAYKRAKKLYNKLS